MPVDLRTRYLGLDLGCPLVASSSPLTSSLSSLRELEEAGAGAVVLPSLFEEELVEDGDARAADVLWHLGDAAGEAGGYLDVIDSDRLESRLDLVRAAKRELSIPVIASLNGSTPGGWTRTAELLQQAGADAIELNVYDVEPDIHATSAGVEDRTLRLVHAVRRVVSIPVAVKLSPFYTAFAGLARSLAEVPIEGLVLFNRFLQPNVDCTSLEVKPELTLSGRDELRLPLRWIAILHQRIPVSFAATSGVHTGEDAFKAILVGADVAMMASSLLLAGPERLHEARVTLAECLEARGFASVAAARGRLSQAAYGNPRAFERAQYVRAFLDAT